MLWVWDIIQAVSYRWNAYLSQQKEIKVRNEIKTMNHKHRKSPVLPNYLMTTHGWKVIISFVWFSILQYLYSKMSKFHYGNCNCKSKRGIYIVLPTGRLREHHKTIISLYPGVHRQTVTKMFSAGVWRWTVVAGRSSFRPGQPVFAEQRQKNPCRQFAGVSAALSFF